MQHDPAKSYLFFTKKERQGTLVVLGLVILIFVCAQYIYPLFTQDKNADPSEIAVASALLKDKQKDSVKNNSSRINYNDEET